MLSVVLKILGIGGFFDISKGSINILDTNSSLGRYGYISSMGVDQPTIFGS